MRLAAGTRLGRHEVLGLVGAGAMGEVYRARDPRLGRDVAIKVLPAEVGADPDRLRRFEEEARAVAALNHPNILTVHDVGTHEGVPYVVTELRQGETLREMASRRAPTQRQVLSFAVQAAQGLEAAHAKGIVHRDVKPENLVVTTDGRVKVLDFGLAKMAGRLASGSAEATESSPTDAVASVGEDDTLRLWLMPDLSKPPLHTLPREALFATLHSLTNLRAVRDASSPTGWKIDIAPFPGWRDVPAW